MILLRDEIIPELKESQSLSGVFPLKSEADGDVDGDHFRSGGEI